MAKNDKKKSSHGFGVAALAAAAAAGLYFLYGSKSAAKNRKRVRSWMFKAKGEVLEKMEQYKELREVDYHKIVDTVVNRYKNMKSVNTREAQDLARELKRQWKDIKREAQQAGSRPKKRAVKKRKAKKVTQRKKAGKKIVRRGARKR